MDTKDIIKHVEENFVLRYRNFRNFQEKPEYAEFWDLCIKAVSDAATLHGIIFCNDVYQIPPTKSFLIRYYKEFKSLTNPANEKTVILDDFTKRSIGAFWGTVFKFALDYGTTKNITITTKEQYNLQSASYFVK